MADPSREQAFLQQRQDAHRAMDAALQKLRTCNPTSLSSPGLKLPGAADSFSRCPAMFQPHPTRRWAAPLCSHSAAFPPSVACLQSTLPARTSITPPAPPAAAAAAPATWQKRLRSGPSTSSSRFAAVADAPPVAATTSKLDPLAHDPVCSSLGATTKHCDCSLKQARLARRQARKQQRLSRWFAAKRAEEAGADADDEADELRTPVAAVPRASGAPHLRRVCFIHIARAHTRAAGV
ncbi:hypothetical protein B0H13DRAFT_2354274 [Mycena leptocephala]|nr:hypothetical protein B0H13DRAFT_2354274 [Mycena leptocephala]